MSVGPTDHQQMLDVVAADQHQPAAAIDGSGVDHRQPGHASAVGVGPEAVSGEAADEPCGDADQRQHDNECQDESNDLHIGVPGHGGLPQLPPSTSAD
ncbi:hypothetical protein ACVWW1_000816 [Bradyrhizobium sp. JR3.5]